jgi:hypothetical protein
MQIRITDDSNPAFSVIRQEDNVRTHKFAKRESEQKIKSPLLVFVSFERLGLPRLMTTF